MAGHLKGGEGSGAVVKRTASRVRMLAPAEMSVPMGFSASVARRRVSVWRNARSKWAGEGRAANEMARTAGCNRQGGVNRVMGHCAAQGNPR